MKRIIGPLVVLAFSWPILADAIGNDEPPSHSVDPELYATGFELAEGPALNETGSLFVVNYRYNGTIGRITRDGTAGVFCDLAVLAPVEGGQPRASGLKLDGQGRLIAADSGGGRLLRIDADGQGAELLADRWEGKHFNSIHDVALDLQGNIYFTDPGGSSVRNPDGSVFCYNVATTKVSRLVTGMAFPNGVAVTPDQKHLCVAEGRRYRVWIYDFAEDGSATNGRVLIDFPTETRGKIIGGLTLPDGMIFDAAGRLYVAMSTGGVVDVVEVPSGTLIRQYGGGGDRVTNCHFHDGYLYTTVAAKEAVFRLKLGVEGFDYNGTEPSEARPQPRQEGLGARD